MPCRHRLSLVSMIAAGIVAAASAAAPSVNATLEPSEISVGESSRLSILTSGNGGLSVTLPVVSGLEFRVVGQSRQIQIINGVTLESTSTIVRVTPEVPGIFTIPALSPKSPPLVLRVNPSSGNGSPAPSNGAPGSAPLVPGGAGGIRLTPDGAAFVHLGIPKHELYVGESIPVEIQVGMRDGTVASVNGLPTLNSGDFTLNNLSHQPERAARVVDGKPFTVLTWRSLLAAVKPGSFSLTFQTPLTVKIRIRPRQDSLLDDLLGDPFLQNFFAATVPKNITVTSPAAMFTVLPLPAQGKPADFGGAVGTFKISSDISSATNTAGDPLTLRMHIDGTGNFDRVDSGMLAADRQWKTYAPKATFKAGDAIGYRGEKIFEQPLIASSSGPHSIPALSFTYFNPDARRYQTARSSSLSVAVSPAAAESAVNQPPTPPAANTAGTNPDASHTGLRPDHAVPDARVDSLIPLYFQPRFLALPSVLALLFGGGWVALRRREHNACDLERNRERARLQLIRTLLQQMAAASAAGDAAAFLNVARSSLQQNWGAHWRIAPEEITIADVTARLQGRDRDDLCQIFALADEANYSGATLKAAEFAHWTQVVRRSFTGGQPS